MNTRMRSHLSIYLLLISVLLLSACETVIDPRLQFAEPVLVIDAWITNKPEPQVVKLMKTQPYMENSLPPGVKGATVTIQDSNGESYTFEESEEAGVYTWTPAPGERFGETGLSYTLLITVAGDSYTSTTKMGRVPPIDSLTFQLQEGNQFITDLYLAEFWATDPLEPGDTYWIKTYKNSVLLNKPSEINLAYDAGFTRGGNFSGIAFIAPIRTAINPFDQDTNNNLVSPYVVGDSLFVELHSLSEASFDFMTQVVIQTDRPGGFSELFATPLANVSTNISPANPSGKKAVGFFNVAAVSGLGRKFASLDDVTKGN
jgi:hypothetical protein